MWSSLGSEFFVNCKLCVFIFHLSKTLEAEKITAVAVRDKERDHRRLLVNAALGRN